MDRRVRTLQASANGWIYIIRDPDRAGHGIAAIAVADLEHALAELRERDIHSGPTEQRAENARKAVVVDPDGSSIGIIEAHGQRPTRNHPGDDHTSGERGTIAGRDSLAANLRRPITRSKHAHGTTPARGVP